MSTRARKSPSASSSSSRMMSAGGRKKAPQSTTKSSTASTTKGSMPQRKVSRTNDQVAPTTARKISVASNASSHSRKMSAAAGVNHGSAASTKKKPGEGGEDMMNLKQSFQSLMIAKRMARSLRQRTSQRLADRRGVSFVSYMDRPRRRSPSAKHLPQIENTYQLEPRELFSSYVRVIRDIIESTVESRLTGMKYDPKLCSKEAEELSEIIKERVKTLDIDRYKLITLVHIGKMHGQGLQVCSRNSWDPARDSFVSYRFQNASVFCVATIYGVYFE
eukprot:XP_003726104.1 PREDICTED: tctex1 domain-containing protein 1-B-like [Strongylocentrotus purpuratus]